jgi:NADH:ubiquinone oxidoreductase subunit F (NADH-binding)
MAADAADVRAVRSFFAMPGGKTPSVGVCRGLSCEINGARDVALSIEQQGPCETLYCLGMCHDSPAVLIGGERILHGHQLRGGMGQIAATLAQRPDIRSASRRPVVTARLRAGSHHLLQTARQAGVYQALQSALLTMTPDNVLDVVESSGQQGRGGAGFPTGRKWRACAQARDPRRYVVANGDEGDPGSFIDRLLLEEDPHAVIEGLVLCAYAVGAGEGVIYIRAEYPLAQKRISQAIAEAREAGLLGPSLLGSGFDFDLRMIGGQGSYVCGEETALLNAIEGRRGEVRVRPPYPTEVGLFGRPTVVNNIETLVSIPWILREGASAFRQLGTASSPGTKAFCLNCGFSRPGVVEAEFGITLRDLIEEHGGGGSRGQHIVAVALGGPMGSILAPEEWGVRLDYRELREQNIQLGHGGLVALQADTDLVQVLRSGARFMSDESCGRCTPCALGSRHLREALESWDGTDVAALTKRIKPLLELIGQTSLCGFGQGIPRPLIDLLQLLSGKQAAGRDGA